MSKRSERMLIPRSPLDITRYKKSTVEREGFSYSFGRKHDIVQHNLMLEKEFAGRTQLELFHAQTIVSIRRKIELSPCLKNFKFMWMEESEFLCNNLDSRWLVAACDTIIDHFECPVDVGFASGAILFANTMKLYETERIALGIQNKKLPASEKNNRVPLFDGMSGFQVGRGEMIDNMLTRISTIKVESISLEIMRELIRRANKYDTIYRRLLDSHVNENTSWTNSI